MINILNLLGGGGWRPTVLVRKKRRRSDGGGGGGVEVVEEGGGAVAPPCVKEYDNLPLHLRPVHVRVTHLRTICLAESPPRCRRHRAKCQVRSPLHWRHSSQCQKRCSFGSERSRLGSQTDSSQRRACVSDTECF